MVVDPLKKNTIIIRLVEDSTIIEVDRIIIGENKYGEHNITDIVVYESYIYVLTHFTKTIYQYIINQDGINLHTIINKTSFPGEYFSPQELKIDSRGRLWVKQFNFILIIEVEELKMWKI